MMAKQGMKIAILLSSFFMMSSVVFAHSGSHDGGSNAHEIIPIEQFYNRVVMSEKNGFRYIETNGIPDHKTGQFPNAGNPNKISEQKYRFRTDMLPRVGEGIIWSSDKKPPYYFGVALNGIPFDPATAEAWNNNPRSGWNEEAIVKGQRKLGLDQNNAHVQPDGSYHYHGIPWALFNNLKKREKPMVHVGYAADGFPIYVPVKREPAMMSSYRLKQGLRPSGPGGSYDGTYTQDYEYVESLSDLDECNGLIWHTEDYPYGIYMYILTEEFPFIPRCWRGRVDTTFEKAPPPRRLFGRRPR